MPTGIQLTEYVATSEVNSTYTIGSRTLNTLSSGGRQIVSFFGFKINDIGQHSSSNTKVSLSDRIYLHGTSYYVILTIDVKSVSGTPYVFFNIAGNNEEWNESIDLGSGWYEISLSQLYLIRWSFSFNVVSYETEYEVTMSTDDDFGDYVCQFIGPFTYDYIFTEIDSVQKILFKRANMQNDNIDFIFLLSYHLGFNFDDSYGVYYPRKAIFTEVGGWRGNDIDTISSNMKVVYLNPSNEYIDETIYFGTVDSGDGGTVEIKHSKAPNKFSDEIESILEAIADKLDRAVTFPRASFDAPEPFKFFANILNDICNDIVAPGFEYTSDLIIDVFKLVILEFGYLGDGVISTLKTLLESNYTNIQTYIEARTQDVLVWLKDIISIESDGSYYEISDKLTTIMEAIEESVPENFLDNLKARRTRMYPYAILQFALTNIRIPKDLNVKIFGNSTGWSLPLEELLYLLIGPFYLIRNNKVPFSEYMPYDLDDPVDRERHFTYSGNGFIFREMWGDQTEYGAYSFLISLISKFLGAEIALNVGRKLVNKTVPFQPSNKQILNAIGTQYDNTFSLVGESLKSGVDDIPENPLLDDDSRLTYVDSAISEVLQSSDSRLDYVDSAISLVLQNDDVRLDNLDVPVSSIDVSTDVLTIVNNIASIISKVDDIATDVLINFNLLDEGNDDIITLTNELEQWHVYLNLMSLWLSNPNAMSRPVMPSS